MNLVNFLALTQAQIDSYCSNLMPIIKLVKNGLIPILQIGIPILLIVFGMIDLGKAVIAGKEDEMKKAQSSLIKRAIYAIAVFFVVTLVTVIFSLFANSGAQGEMEESGNSNQAEYEIVSWIQCWNKG